MRKSNPSGHVRRNVTLPANILEDMAAAREKTGAASDSEVIRNAFRLYKRVLDNEGIDLFEKNRETGEEIKIVIA